MELEDGVGNEADAYVLLGACPSECLDFEAPPGKLVIRVGGSRMDGWDVPEADLPRAVARELASLLGKGAGREKAEERGGNVETKDGQADLVVQNLGDGILSLAMNRPGAMNALDGRAISGLKDAFRDCASDRGVKVVLLTGKGKAFVAGADLSQLAGFGPKEAAAFSRRGYELFEIVESLPQPVVAVINGFALGGGLELAMACDFRLAGAGVQMGLPEVLLGIIPGFGGTQRLKSLVGLARARDLVCSGRRITAEEAIAWGLVDRVFPAEQLWEESVAFARELAAKSASALEQAKRVLNGTRGVTLEEGLRVENEAFSRCFEHPDSREGIRAFLEKRRPEFGKAWQ